MALFTTYDNFVRIHKTPHASPAMASGFTERLWEVSGIVALLEAVEPKPGKRGCYKTAPAESHLISIKDRPRKIASKAQMALYRVNFLDFGENIFATHDVERDDDAAAIEAAHGLNVLRHMTVGFEVWDADRLVHKHQN